MPLIFGEQAAKIGLIDECVSSPEEFLIKKFGSEVQIQTAKSSWKEKIGLSAMLEMTLPDQEWDVDLTFEEFLAKELDLKFEYRMPASKAVLL